MQLGIAIVGAGQVANVHLQALAQTDTVHIVGIHDRDRERAAARAVGRVYDAWDDLLKDPEVQAVAVLLPHDLHERFATEALTAGKHVVCEKPLGQNVAECRRMLDAAAKAGRTLLPVHNRVYSHTVERMQEIVSQDGIGQVVLAQTTGFEGPNTVGVRPWLATPSGGGGVLMAQAVHPAYALRWILGDVARVSCQFGDLKVVDMTAEDTAVATLKFASGALAEMTATFGIAHGPFDHSITFHGRDGYLHLSRGRLTAIAPRLYGDKEPHEIELPTTDLSATAFRRMWDDYANGLSTGAATRMTGLDGLRAVEVIEAAYRSNAAGRAVDLPLDG